MEQANENFQNARVLITGGGGFIGASLAHSLLAKGAQVDLLDRWGESENSSAHSLGITINKALRLIEGDVLTESCFEELNTNYDYIVHAAAILGIKKVCVEPVSTLRVNILGTENCLQFALKNSSLKRVMVFSTSEIYGPEANSLSETDSAVVPASGNRWCYATSKLAGEWLARAYGHEHKLPTVVVRPFNVYGPHRKGTNAVTSILNGLMTDRPVMVSGSGEQVRAWCYIQDFVDGLEACLTEPGAVNEIFNIGNPRETSTIKELAALAGEVTGSASPVIVTGSDEPDVLFRIPNISKAQRILNYRPKVTLRQGLLETAEWMNLVNATGARKAA